VGDREILVFGAGGHAKVVLELLEAIGGFRVRLLDDDPSKRGTEIAGERVEGGIADAARFVQQGAALAAVALGDNARRAEIGARAAILGLRLPVFVHPRALVSPRAALGEGSVVFAGAILAADSIVGRYGILNHGASVDHDCRIGEAVHIAPGACLAGSVTVGDHVTIGIGASVIPGRTIGAGAVVGAGSCVVEDVPAGAVVAGVPARPLRA
jgi:UDP-perosamine 4-acetyltransferase